VQPELSVIVPARDEEACLAACLESLVGQRGVEYEVIVIDDHSTDQTREIAERFPVRVIAADELPDGWSGKCNAVWTGAKAAKGKWLLFTDADTRHAPNSISAGLREALEHKADLLSYSPRQEVCSLAESALMPVVFAELAATYRPRDVCDPQSTVAAANGQYLLIQRNVYDAIGGHAAVAIEILEDVELAKRVKQAGYKLRFHVSDLVATRMYRSFPQMWEGWTKNLALLFPHPIRLAAWRFAQFVVIFACVGLTIWQASHSQTPAAFVPATVAVALWAVFLVRIRRAHFDPLSNVLAIFGLPLFAALLVNSSRAHGRGSVNWKGRTYGSHENNLSSSGPLNSVRQTTSVTRKHQSNDRERPSTVGAESG
jgi:cellulose synthase/poly-beta-1,6-N-acetylglucosamine synthase-like glycosyltransferase